MNSLTTALHRGTPKPGRLLFHILYHSKGSWSLWSWDMPVRGPCSGLHHMARNSCRGSPSTHPRCCWGSSDEANLRLHCKMLKCMWSTGIAWSPVLDFARQARWSFRKLADQKERHNYSVTNLKHPRYGCPTKAGTRVVHKYAPPHCAVDHLQVLGRGCQVQTREWWSCHPPGHGDALRIVENLRPWCLSLTKN